MANYKTMINQALEMLKDDDDLFCSMVDELDAWNGYADGFRCYDMSMIDELFCDMKVSDFLAKLGDFNYREDYFYDSIYGIESTDDKTGLYRCNVDEEELLDRIIENASHLYFYDSEFEDLIESIVNYSEDDDETDAA